MDRMRRMLFAVLLMGIVGTGAELLLTSHYEDFWQKVPIMLLTAGLLSTLAVAATGRGVVSMRVLMLLFMIGGALGTYFHYESNAEFAAELSPGLSGFELVKAALTRPTPPPLAPGTMIMLGLIGLICCYGIRGPRASRAQGD